MTKMLKSSFDAAELARIVERKVYEAMKGADADFQPFFQPHEVYKEIRARQTTIERERFIYAYEDWGCMRCGTKDRPHKSLWMCEPCYYLCHQRLRSSLQKRLDEAGKPQEFVDAALLAKQALAPAIPKLLYDTGKLLPAESTEKYLRMDEAAAEVGIPYSKLIDWIRKGKINRPSVMLNKKSFLWTEQDMERLRKFVAKNAAFLESRRSTAEVARQLGVKKRTVEDWVRQGKVRPSLGRGRMRYWNEADIERLRELMSIGRSE